MAIGMVLHKMAFPRPPKPSFKRTIASTISPRPGNINLQFYVPPDYKTHSRLQDKTYPVVVNFHGGGFTLGTATDDARWCKTVVDECTAVVVSVDYRRAPEHPFPTAVEDGVDAIKYLALHAEELCIDPDRIAVSGFSSGGNMCFTVPLRLQEEFIPDPAASMEDLSIPQKSLSTGRILVHTNREIKVKAIVSWYPPTDYTVTREQRRMTCARPDQQLPAVFTSLFDESYLHPPTMDLASPYLSPGVASTPQLAGLPEDIILYTCEWDMLLAEGERLRDRLLDMGKNVIYHCVPGVPHAWDKAPNPLRPTPGVQEHYVNVCKEMRRILRTSPTGSEERRRSMSVVR